MQVEEVLQFFSKYIFKELGIVYAEHNLFQLQNRLEEICKIVGVQNIEELYKLAQSGVTGDFKQLLLDLATNNETSFFRDNRIFLSIEKNILPELVKNKKPGEPIRFWSAASSSGQEALSLTIMIKEFGLKNSNFIDFKILGSDISERILNKAKAFKYSQLEIQRGLSAPLMLKYFEQQNDSMWLAKSEISQHIEYKKINLKDSIFLKENFDIIFCRNVLIYQNVEGKIDILNRLSVFLKPGGYLVLGAGESLMGLSDQYEQVNVDGAIFYRKKMLQAKIAS